jgi:uncharacterized membrane protein
MSILIAGLVVFFAIHFVPSMAGLRQSLIDRMGATAYQGAFTVIALIGFLLIVWGKSAAEFVFVYDPPDWGRHVAMLLVLLTFILLVSYQLQGHIRKMLRHPMLIAVVLWGVGHLFANGDLASVLLFGSFALYGVVDIVLANARGPAKGYTPSAKHDAIAVVGGIAVYAVFLFAHPWIFGVAVLQ